MRSYIAAATALVGALFFMPTTAQAEFYQKYKSISCPASVLQCSVRFTIPLLKTLRLSNLSCYLRIAPTVDIYGMQLLVTDGGIIHAVTPSLRFLNSVVVDTSTGARGDVYVSNDSIQAVGTSLQEFRVYVEGRLSPSGNNAPIQQLACHISGEMT